MSILSFDVGGSAVKYGVVQNGLLIEQSSFKTPESWCEMLSELDRVHQELSSYTFSGIAMSVPGSVDSEQGVIGGVSAIDYIHDFPIVATLKQHFNLPVTIENDANCAALAELDSGAAKDHNNVLFVVVGTGIGGAIIHDRTIMKGRNTFAGEFGCMILDGETSFSLLATAVHMAERYSLRKNEAMDTYSGEEVFKLAEMGDEIALDEVNKFYDYLTLGLYNLQFTTDPEAIIIGGGVTQYKPLIPQLNERMKQRLQSAGLESVQFEIKAAHYLNDANLMGAVVSYHKQKGEPS